jgi:hypothetical protein
VREESQLKRENRRDPPMKNTALLFISIFFAVILCACGSGNSDLNGNWQSYQNDELGISFELPETWVVQEVGGAITLAMDQEALDDDLSTGAGATIMLATADDFEGWTVPSDILGLFMDYMVLGREDLEKVSEPEFITIQDQPAGIVSYRGTVQAQTGLFIAVAITNEDHIALVLAFDGSEGEQHQETLERITNSIFVYPPSE